MAGDWKVVPVEPTPEMIEAYERTNPEDHWTTLPDAGDGTTRRQRDGDAVIYYRAMLAAAPEPPSASDERAYPAVTYAKAFRFLGSLVNPLFETKFVGDAAHSSEIPNAGLVGFVQALIDEDRAALAPSPGVDAAEQKPVYTIQVRGALHTWEPTAQAFKLTNGRYSLYAAPSPAASADEWMAEAERLVDAAMEASAEEEALVSKNAATARAALLAHLKARP